jgi:2-phospho-L-lactate guanylyltransferase
MTTRPFMRAAWAVVPVKRFDRAKTRLAEVLSPGERRDLARAMLADVFDALGETGGLNGVVVVTCDAEASAMAQARGFEAIADPEEAGVNAAVSIGLRHVTGRGGAALVAPADIPFVSAAEIGQALFALVATPVAIAPAARDGGTNILAMASADLMKPAFGRDSAARHVACARALGIEPAVLRLAGASRDIDTAADLADLGLVGAPRTRACLAGSAARAWSPVGRMERAAQ